MLSGNQEALKREWTSAGDYAASPDAQNGKAAKSPAIHTGAGPLFLISG
jgi:hypothetical protein